MCPYALRDTDVDLGTAFGAGVGPVLYALFLLRKGDFEGAWNGLGIFCDKALAKKRENYVMYYPDGVKIVPSNGGSASRLILTCKILKANRSFEVRVSRSREAFERATQH